MESAVSFCVQAQLDHLHDLAPEPVLGGDRETLDQTAQNAQRPRRSAGSGTVAPGITRVHVEQHPRDIALDRVARLEAVSVARGVPKTCLSAR